MTHPFLLPGWCLGRGPLQAIATALNGQLLDLPGYGQRPPEADFVAACQNIASELPTGSDLIGWSLGAQMALAIAALQPPRVRRVVLIAGTASFIQREGWSHAMPPDQLTAFRNGVSEDLEGMLPRFVGGFNRGDAEARRVTRDLLALADPRPPLPHLLAGLDWLREVDLRPLLPQIRCPVLLVHGTADPLMPIGAANALQTQLPNARLAPMADCAHAPFISQPENFLACVRAFCNEPTA